MEPWITGTRILLRDLRPEDWSDVHLYARREDTTAHMPWGPNQPEQTQGFVEEAVRQAAEEDRVHFNLGVIDQESGRLIGGARLSITARRIGEGTIGFVLHPSTWDRGIGTEAARLLLELGFERLGLRRIVAYCDVSNVASERILMKVGMIHEGRMREKELIRGEYRDQFVYSILRKEWDPTAEISGTTTEEIENTWIR